MQLLGHYMSIYADGGKLVSDSILDLVMRRSEADFIQDICQTTLKTLSEVDIAFLRAMSVDADVSRVSDLSERMNAKADYIQIYKRRLLDAGVIEQCGRGLLRFAVPYLRESLLEDGRQEEQELLRAFRLLDEKQKKRLFAYMKKLQ